MSTNSRTIIYCTTFKKRFLGLMFQKNFTQALCFPHCNSIHTFFMKSPILVIMTTKQNIVVLKKIVNPWKIVGPIKGAYYTYEYPPTEKISINLGEEFQG